ncbi:hypothetical protein PRBRB14_07670 [Hallella multisaccharivorax DSM 17128]|nr:hypothetical protein PRBRB14_07670 [Hallella multisaccharivorax DSM 17128]
MRVPVRKGYKSILSKKTKTHEKEITFRPIIGISISSSHLFTDALFGEYDDEYRQYENHTGITATGIRLQDRKGKRAHTQEYSQSQPADQAQACR